MKRLRVIFFNGTYTGYCDTFKKKISCEKGDYKDVFVRDIVWIKKSYI